MSALTFTKATPATRRAKVLLVGDAGTGKSHAALTFPNPAVIDAEGSIDWFADRFSFSSVNTKSYQDARALLEQIRNGHVDCETVVVDSLTSIYNGLLMAASANRDDLRPLDWGRIKRKFSSLLDELYHKLDKHIVCIGWIKAEYAKPGDVVNGQKIGANDLIKVGEVFDGDKKTMHAFDFVFKIEGNDGKRTRAVVIKSRSGALVAGQRIEDFSFATIAKLLPSGTRTATGMSDEEQIARDREPDEPPAQPVRAAADADAKAKLIQRARDLSAIPKDGDDDAAISALKAYAKAKGVTFGAAAIHEHFDAMVPASETKAPPVDEKSEVDAKPAQEPATAKSGVLARSAGTDHVTAMMTSAAQRALAMRLHGELKHTEDERRTLYQGFFGKSSFKDLTPADVSALIDNLNDAIDASVNT